VNTTLVGEMASAESAATRHMVLESVPRASAAFTPSFWRKK
jgi:hypothetical protein